MHFKKLIFLFFLLISFSTSSIVAQFEVKTNALGLINNNYNGQVELLLGDKSGLDLEVSYRTTPWILALSGSEINNSAFRALVSYKYYLGAEDPTSGLFFGPYVRLKVGNLKNIPVSLDDLYTGSLVNPEKVEIFSNSITLGLSVGQKIVFNNNFLIEYYAGLGYNAVNTNNIRNDLPNELTEFINIETNTFTWPWDFRLGISLGYRIWK